MLPTTTDVLVIGAGPTGLTVAVSLAGQGTRRDRRRRSVTAGANTSRAAVVHARTLEVLEELGVSEAADGPGASTPRGSPSRTATGNASLTRSASAGFRPPRYPRRWSPRR